MEENQAMTENNEDVVNPVLDEVSKSNSNLLIKIIVGAVIATAGIGGVILYRRKKKLQEKVVTINSEEVDVDIKENDENAIEE